jgi:hypothetical protein
MNVNSITILDSKGNRRPYANIRKDRPQSMRKDGLTPVISPASRMRISSSLDERRILSSDLDSMFIQERSKPC